MNITAKLVLEDGTVFKGFAIGIIGTTVGELLFNTAHVGYQETLTDPSYTGQLIIFTTPHIGNVGCNISDEESDRIYASGLILREKPTKSSYWRAEINLQNYLVQQGVVGIAEVDTRYLTRLLRDRGLSMGCITSEDVSVDEARKLAVNFREVCSAHLLNKVTTHAPYLWRGRQAGSFKLPHLVVYDFGLKRNILYHLERIPCRITVVPAWTTMDEICGLEVDGIVLSNGPGDPFAYTDIINIVTALTSLNLPILGICLGHQLLGLALGGQIEKLKFGHHGINHPIQELETGRIFISSQNHNFVLSKNSLPNDITITYRSLFDDSIQGIQHRYKPFLGVQGHPEGCPGPTEFSLLFDKFFQLVTRTCQNRRREEQYA